MNSDRKAVVVGAGIVGVCCAIELRRRGWEVDLVDRLAPGEGCSAGNAGILAAQAVVPVAMPGLLRKVPAMLLDADSPLSLRLASLPHTWGWLLRFARAANLAQVRRTSTAMKALYGSTVERHQALAREAGVPELVCAQPGLYVHRDPAGIDLANGLSWVLRREHGAQVELLEGAALREAEPALAPEYTRGVRVGPMAHTTDPLRLTQAYAALLERMGGRLRRAEVRALLPDGAAVQVFADGQALRADVVVVAAGAWSAALLRPLGLRLPLVAERGYHMTYADPGIRLNHVVSEVGAHLAVTSMAPGLRVAGTEEIGLADDPPSWRRAEVLDRLARRMFPGAVLGEGSRWMGPRPGTPDSLPIIGPVPGHGNVFIAAGHGHLGLTGAPHTGAIVAAMASGETPEADVRPYALERF